MPQRGVTHRQSVGRRYPVGNSFPEVVGCCIPPLTIRSPPPPIRGNVDAWVAVELVPTHALGTEPPIVFGILIHASNATALRACCKHVCWFALAVGEPLPHPPT